MATSKTNAESAVCGSTISFVSQERRKRSERKYGTKIQYRIILTSLVQ